MFAFLQNIGMSELVVVLLIALLLFGPGRLPEVARSLSKAIQEFKKGIKKLGDEEDKEDR